MKFVKVEFPSDEDAAKALAGLSQRGRVTVLREGAFIIPAPGLEWLKEQAIPCRVLQRLNHDDVVQTLRNHLAHPA